MVKQPAVIIIARHGARLDAADNQWHLHTPTPYDPPLTYGGWNQCRALGQRIESLLQAREDSINATTNEPLPPASVKARDFALGGQSATGQDDQKQERKRKRKHKVVIHSSPFTRCLQTSVAIAAGLSAHQPAIETLPRPRTPSTMHSASPRMKAQEAVIGSIGGLPSISEPLRDLTHELARKRQLEEQRSKAGVNKRHRRTKLRVDAFLGEWLNPSYFENIMHPPQSELMVAGAKGELTQNEPLDSYTPTIGTPHSMASSSLWGGGRSVRSSSVSSRESTLDGLSELAEQLPPPQQGRKSRHNSLESNGTSGGRIQGSGRNKAAGRNGRPGGSGQNSLQPLSSFQPSKQQQQQTLSETPLSSSNLLQQPFNFVPYTPPTPNWAISPSDPIPRGYVTHAREACSSIDFQWDSSRPPQNWGDGGEYGEEWSALHRRFRRGLNHMVHWYAQHNADDRGEDALGFEQAEKQRRDEELAEDGADDDEDEDLVVVLVTHGAGCNALIGALTGQPVLLDVGMASLTMAVRRPDAPNFLPPLEPGQEPNIFGHRRRSSINLGLSEIYEMKLVASSEHLRPGTDPSRINTLTAAGIAATANLTRPQGQKLDRSASTSVPGYRVRNTEPQWMDDSLSPSNTSNSALGSMRRPSSSGLLPPVGGVERSASMPHPSINDAVPEFRGGPVGLWTPPGGRSPNLAAVQKDIQSEQENKAQEHSANITGAVKAIGQGTLTPPPSSTFNGASDTATSRADKPTPESLLRLAGTGQKRLSTPPSPPPSSVPTLLPPPQLDGSHDSDEEAIDDKPRQGSLEIPSVEKSVPLALQRGLSQKGLWGARPTGDKIERTPPRGGEVRRRWTLGRDGVEGP